ncbi:hypothetical protein ACFLTU_05785 [Bacteroidota bacterium]
MMKILTIIVLTIWSFSVFAQNHPDKLKIFIDCDHCDDEQIRQQISGVDYVYDQSQANLHLLITQQSTGSGGHEINVSFIPSTPIELKTFTLTTYTSADATTDMERMKTLEAIRFGLMPFLFSTGQEEIVKIDMDQNDRETSYETDPFNYWVFAVRASGDYEAEDSQRKSGADVELQACRTTEIWRIESEAHASYEFKWARDDEREITSDNNEKEIKASAVYSISTHWSAGVSGELSSDTYRNMKTQVSMGPAIEYNFFPWKESDRRRFTVSYHVNAVRQAYFEETIYNKMDEVLARQGVRAEIELIQPWGDFEIALEGQNYLHDLNRYGVSLESDFGIRVFKGLSVFMESGVHAIHDQLYLPKGGSSIEDILIQRRKQATSLEFQGQLGFRYTFGSIYNNVVNRRL